MEHFDQVTRHHRHRIFTFACYFLGDRDDAEDATQEVLIRLWHHGREVAAERLPAWVLRVTRNVCLDQLRKRKSYRAVFDVNTDGVESSAGDARSPLALLESSEARTELERALAALAEPYRSIVILREIQDLSYEQIGETLHLPLTSVKVYLHRGRKALRDALKNARKGETTG